MEFKISGRHMDITDPIREYAEKKSSRLPRYFDRIQSIDVVVDQRDRSFHVEMVVDIERADDIRAHAEGEDVYACIDAASERAERQLTDHKEKLRNRKHSA